MNSFVGFFKIGSNCHLQNLFAVAAVNYLSISLWKNATLYVCYCYIHSLFSLERWFLWKYECIIVVKGCGWNSGLVFLFTFLHPVINVNSLRVEAQRLQHCPIRGGKYCNRIYYYGYYFSSSMSISLLIHLTIIDLG